jgi:glycolate oxidase
VEELLRPHGLTLRFFPQSFEFSTLGGWIATRAGGHFASGPTHIDDLVEAVRAVTPGAGVWQSRRLPGSGAGPSPDRLLLGSEGTLGVITELTLRLVPAPPPASTLVAAFPSIEAAADAVIAITSGLRPSMLELMDRTSINAVEDYTSMGLDRSAEALLIARSDAPGGAAAHEIALMQAAVSAHGASEMFATDDVEEGDAFVAARRAAFPALERRGDLLLEDVGVALPDLPALVRGVEKIAADNATTIALVAHAGDGNTHPLVVYDAGDEAAVSRAQLAFGEVMDLAISLGGTITGEHGVGRLKRDWLPAYLGDDVLALTRRVKDALDPLGILNPGAAL